MNRGNDLMCEASASGDCVAVCTPDGVVKFYDALTGNLKLEYASSTHLQAACTCLSWSRHKKKDAAETTTTTTATGQRKKAKTGAAETSRSIETELNDLDLIAIGTSQGSILLYSLSKAALHSELSEGGHTDKVTDICWCPQFKDSLFSCSDDGFVVEWSLVESKVKAKWRASKTSVTSLAVDPSSKYLVCSSKTITVWDLGTKKKLKTLTGHSNDIFKLRFLAPSDTKAADGLFFLSAAVNDRVINAWKIDEASLTSDSGNQAALLSFSIPDGPVYLDLVRLGVKPNAGASAFVSVVTSKGNLQLFKQDLESSAAKNNSDDKKLKKPVKPSNQLQMETKEGALLKVHCAFLLSAGNERVESYGSEDLAKMKLCVVYGSHLAPVIEKIPLSEFMNESKCTLKRDDPLKMSVTLQTQTTKIETPAVSKDLKVLAPGYMNPQTNNSLTANTKRKTIEPSQMALEERLNAMGIEAAGANGDGYLDKQAGLVTPKVDNLLVLLVQGLQSNDAKMLNHVLQHKNEKVVAKTVRMMPSNYIITLVKELNKRLQGHAQSGIGIIKWLKCVLMIHTSFLMSYPDLIDSLGSVYEMMNARTKLFPQLSKLQGKLQLIMSQISSQAEMLQAGNVKDSQPLLYYQDSTSEDEQIEDELIPSHSEFDEYLFSDEEDADENDDEDDDAEDEDDGMELDEDEEESSEDEKPLKTPKASFKKSQSGKKDAAVAAAAAATKDSKKSQKKKQSEDEDDDDEDEDEEEGDELLEFEGDDADDDDEDEDEDDDDEEDD